MLLPDKAILFSIELIRILIHPHFMNLICVSKCLFQPIITSESPSFCFTNTSEKDISKSKNRDFLVRKKKMTVQERLGSYRDMLLKVSQYIDQEDLVRMKFKCGNIIKKKQSEKINNVLDLFTSLEERGHLGPTNTAFLKDLLQTCCDGKVGGLYLLQQYEESGDNAHGQSDGQYPGLPPVPQQPPIVYDVSPENGRMQNATQQRNHPSKGYSVLLVSTSFKIPRVMSAVGGLILSIFY